MGSSKDTGTISWLSNVPLRLYFSPRDGFSPCAPCKSLEGAGYFGQRHRRYLCGGGRPPRRPFDANGDGSLIQAEVDQFRADRLAKFDIMATDG